MHEESACIADWIRGYRSKLRKPIASPFPFIQLKKSPNLLRKSVFRIRIRIRILLFSPVTFKMTTSFSADYLP